MKKKKPVKQNVKKRKNKQEKDEKSRRKVQASHPAILRKYRPI
jgi:hypothetical protein